MPLRESSWHHVGSRIRNIRKTNQLTMKQLAKGCGISLNTLSLVERGEVAPTVSTLCKIAQALGVSASVFFQEICPPQLSITRAKDLNNQSFSFKSLNDIRSPSDRTQSDINSPCATPKQKIQTALCISGQLSFEINDQAYDLEPGDHLTFHQAAFHRWSNPGDQTGIAVIVLPPQIEESES